MVQGLEHHFVAGMLLVEILSGAHMEEDPTGSRRLHRQSQRLWRLPVSPHCSHRSAARYYCSIKKSHYVLSAQLPLHSVSKQHIWRSNCIWIEFLLEHDSYINVHDITSKTGPGEALH